MKTLRATLAMMMIAAVPIAACSGDDDDDIASPTPYFPDICFIIWARPAGTLYDAYVWQGAAALITSGGVSAYEFNVDEFDSVLGFFYYHTDNDFLVYDTLAATTSGAFSLTAAGIQTGDAWQFSDTSNQLYFELPSSGPLLGQVASNGTGAFTGDLSEPEGTPTAGSGTLTIAYLTSTIVMNAQYASCVDETAFTGTTRPSPAVLRSAARALQDLD